MDDELEQLRQKRMNELQKQQGGSYPGEYLLLRFLFHNMNVSI